MSDFVSRLVRLTDVVGVINFCYYATATTQIYTNWHTLSRRDAFPIFTLALPLQTCGLRPPRAFGSRMPSFISELASHEVPGFGGFSASVCSRPDRKSTRLNSSH